MRLGLSLVLFLVTASAALAAPTLSYSTGDPLGWGNYNNQELMVTAKDGGNDIWSMWLWVPTAGDNTTHGWCTPGQIISFKDLQHGGTPYEYSPEVGNSDWWSNGLMTFTVMGNWGGNAGAHFSYDTTHSDYLQFRWTTSGLVHLGSASEPNNTVDTALTVRVYAPTVSGGTFATKLEANYTFTNNQIGSLDTWYMGDTAGAMNMQVCDSGNAGVFVNPKNSLVKPNVHAAGEHPLYQVDDWYGSTAVTIDGALVQAAVKDNAGTAALNMRPGLTFEMDANAMAMYYCGLAGNTYGSTDEGSSYVQGNIGQPGAMGNGVWIDPGQTLGMQFGGYIGVIPEPATMALLLLGGAGILARRRRNRA